MGKLLWTVKRGAMLVFDGVYAVSQFRGLHPPWWEGMVARMAGPWLQTGSRGRGSHYSLAFYSLSFYPGKNPVCGMLLLSVRMGFPPG